MNTECKVINKSAGRVVYKLPELGVRREFYPNEKKILSVKELESLSQTPGGRNLLYNYLLVDDKEIINYLINGKVEPEYWIREEEIDSWMQTCSLEAFKDALDFAPQGTKDLIKAHAVSMPLNDVAKRDAIREQLNFDVSAAIEHLKESNEGKDTPVEKTARRVQINASEETPVRRVVIPE